MQIINLYRYMRENGGVTVSTIMPDVEYSAMFRLVADEGMILTNGDTTTACIDTDDVSIWSEIVKPIEDESTNDNHIDNEITTEILEKAKAYDILMGVSK